LKNRLHQAANASGRTGADAHGVGALDWRFEAEVRMGGEILSEILVHRDEHWDVAGLFDFSEHATVV
jgi:hypothetical protein